MGRKPKAIDKESFEKLCNLQCTESEICGFFDVCEDTLNSWCKRTYEGKTFKETFLIYSSDGRISLRRIQFRLAEKSPAMAIFLGKQYLGQRDVVENVVTTDNDPLSEAVENFIKERKSNKNDDN